VSLYPTWLAPCQPNGVTRMFGFIRPATLHHGQEALPLQPTAGRKLLIFIAGTLGISDRWSESFFVRSINICRRLGCLGFLLGGQPPSNVKPEESVVWRDF